MVQKELIIHLKSLSDHDLYLLARQQTARQAAGLPCDDKKLGLILDECELRNKKIIDTALNDAYFSFPDVQIGRRKCIGLKRIDFMTEDELKHFVSNFQPNFLTLENISFDMEMDKLHKLLGIKKENMLLYRVEGDSMVNAGINDGSILIIDTRLGDLNRKIVLVYINDKAFVKRMLIRDGQTWLISENDRFQPVLITEEMDLHIIGIVRHVLISME
jgi:DNA polymerase V